jgi:hypothetical protein
LESGAPRCRVAMRSVRRWCTSFLRHHCDTSMTSLT